MKKERLFYLDFVRAIAAVAIILTHFNAVYLFMNNPMPEKSVITVSVSNIYIGSWGVSLFFIISGAALMYVYDEKCELKKFFQKRFLAIYPMFWIAYSCAFLYLFYVNKGVNNGAPKINMILTILGLDGYLAENIPTFYILGEWFLGAIIIMYLIFPLLRILINKFPVALAIGIIVLYIISIWKYNLPFNQVEFLPT
ncbi:MAG: acyltransferase family protein, partial [Lachnospiraceae bacterium]